MRVPERLLGRTHHGVTRTHETRLPPEGFSGILDVLAGSVGIPDVSSGAGYRVRTGDIQLGKLTLYQLS